MNFKAALAIFLNRELSEFVAASQAVLAHVRRDGLSTEETAALARALAGSGEQIQLIPEDGPYADVPSTGGPASLSTLLCPLLISAAGVKVPKISQSGSVAGAIDTMSLIPGYESDLSQKDFLRVLDEAGYAHTEQNKNMCPADKVMIDQRRDAGLMENPHLAAASLLAKKLMVHGTVAVYDFRVGSTGNIGKTRDQARAAASVFYEVAGLLGVTVKCVLTDNRTFPSSALGRVESMRLLRDIISGESLNLLDEKHVETCVGLSAVACSLSVPGRGLEKFKGLILDALKRGIVQEVLEKHLTAQGGSIDNLGSALREGNERHTLQIFTQSDGYWIPPPLGLASERIKLAEKKLAPPYDLGRRSPKECVGLRLVACPGQFVETGQPVLEVMLPIHLKFDISGLEGRILPSAHRFEPEIVESKLD